MELIVLSKELWGVLEGAVKSALGPHEYWMRSQPPLCLMSLSSFLSPHPLLASSWTLLECVLCYDVSCLVLLERKPHLLRTSLILTVTLNPVPKP